VSELEEEASSLFERQSGLEEELGAAQAQSHAHEQALSAAQAEVQVRQTLMICTEVSAFSAAVPLSRFQIGFAASCMIITLHQARLSGWCMHHSAMVSVFNVTLESGCLYRS